MSYTMSNLIMDVLPRVGKAVPQANGITIWQAANSVQSLIYKRLVYRKSDLTASGELSLAIAAQGYSAVLPVDFVAPAEKPRAEDVYTDWMVGAVTSYDATTGALVLNVTNCNGSDTLASWNVAVAALPGSSSSVIGTSTTSLAVGTGAKSLTTQAGLSLAVGQSMIIFPTSLPETLIPISRQLQPTYLDDDDEHQERDWWNWYGFHGSSWEPPAIRPRKYKIIGSTIYVRPKVIIDVVIKGRYYAKPVSMSQATDVIPWNSLFDEVFREGVVRIMQKGISIPDADQDFMLFINRECDTVIAARARIIPSSRRVHRGSWM